MDNYVTARYADAVAEGETAFAVVLSARVDTEPPADETEAEMVQLMDKCHRLAVQMVNGLVGSDHDHVAAEQLSSAALHVVELGRMHCLETLMQLCEIEHTIYHQVVIGDAPAPEVLAAQMSDVGDLIDSVVELPDEEPR